MNSKGWLTTYKRNAQTTDLQACFPHQIWCKQTLNIFLLHSFKYFLLHPFIHCNTTQFVYGHTVTPSFVWCVRLAKEFISFGSICVSLLILKLWIFKNLALYLESSLLLLNLAQHHNYGSPTDAQTYYTYKRLRDTW